MELKVDEIKALEPIKFNYEELKKELIAKTEEYKSIVYTEDNLKKAKEDRANLNKLVKALKDEFKRVKEEILQPIKPFEEQINELTALVEEASKHADKQIKAFEKAEDEAKAKQILAFWEENAKEYKELINYDLIFNERWLNKTYSMTNIENDIKHILSKTKMDMDTIDGQIKDETLNKQAKAFYFKNINQASVLSLSLKEAMEIDEANKKIKKLEEEKKQQNISNITKTEAKITSNASIIPNSTKNVTKEEKIYTVEFRASGTKEVMINLKEFCKENNIKLEPIQKTEKEQNKMTLVLDYVEDDDEYVGLRYQELSNKHENIYFSVSNLDDCPEDAIIGRDLFTADDYVNTLNKGIELAEKGYTKVIIK